MAEKKTISPYLEYRKSSDIHGTALYPAVMVAPMQRELLQAILPDDEDVTICDPFSGSGTALYEAAAIRPGSTIIGSDINPLAVLITRVKLEGIDEDLIENDIANLKHNLINMHCAVKSYDFYNVDKWFKIDIKQSLSRISQSVELVENDRNRRFFWYMMIDIVRKYCNSRSSTYKLHLRPPEQINRISDHVINDYLKKISEEWKLFKSVHHESCKFNQGDSVEFLKECEPNSIDICITSPPYGDNATTVPYGQYSTLAMSWINSTDLNLDGWELQHYSSIDSRSLGGNASFLPLDEEEELGDDVISNAIGMICERKRRKVVRFMHGYKAFLDEMSNVTSKKAILTLGNRMVDGVRIDLAGYTERYLSSQGYQVEIKMNRPIVNKRTPAKVSQVKGSPVESMKEETVLVVSYQ